jgi:hypothetical protein
MKTKNIFKALAFAMLMPAILLTASCSSDILNDEVTVKEGYTLPVTVNVTRQGDDLNTKATYAGNTLSFSEGDKLFVGGQNTSVGAGYFDGALDWVSEGTFSGTITTQNPYTGEADALFTTPDYIHATLLPADYEDYGYLYIRHMHSEGYGYEDLVDRNGSYTFAVSTTEKTAKALAVEQFSLEKAISYSGGFALAPQNAILSFTITDLAGSTPVEVSLEGGYGTYNITKTVTTDESGNAVFAAGISGRIGEFGGYDISKFTLTVSGGAITIVNSETIVEAGKIYNITRSAAPAAASKALSEVTSSEVGWRIGSNGTAYDPTGTLPPGVTAVAVICYVGDAGTADASSATYKGLALALTDVSGTYSWCDKAENCLANQYKTADGAKTDMAGIANTDALVGNVSHTHAAASAARNYNSGTYPTGTSAWFLPSAGQWEKMATAAGGFSTLMSNANMKSWPYYWSSTDYGDGKAWTYASSKWDYYGGSTSLNVRACLAF